MKKLWKDLLLHYKNQSQETKLVSLEVCYRVLNEVKNLTQKIAIFSDSNIADL